MKKILIPTDFSTCADSATDVGMHIAQKTNASITFMHLFFTPLDWIKMTIEDEKQYPEVKRQITHAKSELHDRVTVARNAGLESEHLLVFGQNEGAIIKHAQSADYDLIIMGSHGASGLKELLIGSKTQHFVVHSKTPVLVIKEGHKSNSIRQIVFASTFEEDTHGAFSNVANLAKAIGADINLLYVNEPDHFEDTRLSAGRIKNYLNKHPSVNYTMHIYNDKYIEDGILHFAEDERMDLIAVATHGRKGFKGLFMDSLTERLVNHSSLPILSVNVQN